MPSGIPHACHLYRPYHHPWFDHPINIQWQVKNQEVPHRSLLQFPATSPLVDSNVSLSTLSSNTPSLCSYNTISINYSSMYFIIYAVESTQEREGSVSNAILCTYDERLF
jgi:hypothetical protein